jgi:hypothetical protein
VAEAKRPSFLQILVRCSVCAPISRGCASGAQHGEFSPHSLKTGFFGAFSKCETESVGHLHREKSPSRFLQADVKEFGGGCPFLFESFWIVIKGKTAPADFDTFQSTERVVDPNAVGETI